MARKPGVDWSKVDDLIYGCANQAGEDNRNVGRMAVLLSGLPVSIPATTVNRLCGSGMDAVGMAARAIRAGDCDFVIAGGVESMSRAPFVMPKADSAFSRANAVYDTTIGWRFVNPKMKKAFGVDSMPETADNVAADAIGTEFVRPCNLCPHMKKISLQNIYEALLHNRYEVTVDPAIADRARLAVQRMVDLPPPAVPASSPFELLYCEPLTAIIWPLALTVVVPFCSVDWLAMFG